MAGEYVVTGRVHPERADIAFGRVEMKLANGDIAVASCDSSQITVSVNAPGLDGWLAAKNVAEDIATIMIGALGFRSGPDIGLSWSKSLKRTVPRMSSAFVQRTLRPEVRP